MNILFHKSINTSLGQIELITSANLQHHFPRHFHETFPFGVVESGALGFHYRGERITAWKGTINLANPGEVHDGFPLSQDGWQYRMFYLDCRFVDEIMKQNKPAAGFPWFSSGVLQNSHLAKQITQLHQDIQSGRLSQLAIETRLFLLLEQMIQQYAQIHPKEKPQKKSPQKLQAVCELMRESCHVPLSLKSLAEFCGFSAGYFIRAFRTFTGMTPHQYQLVCRLECAKKQLGQHQAISQIAQDFGFFDQSHFTHVFKQYYGYTPGIYLYSAVR